MREKEPRSYYQHIFCDCFIPTIHLVAGTIIYVVPPSPAYLLKGEIYTYGWHPLSTCEWSSMENGVFHRLTLITPHRSEEVKQPYVKWFLMLWGAFLGTSALSRKPTGSPHFERGLDPQVNVHLWLWIFLYFFCLLLTIMGRLTVNSVAAPPGDSPQIKVHFMVQIQRRTRW